MSNIPLMLTIHEAAKTFNLSQNYVRSLCLQDKIVYVKAGKKFLINANKLIEYLNQGDGEC